MDFSRYIRFLDPEGTTLTYGRDWGVNEFPDGQIQIWFDQATEVGRELVCMNHPSTVQLIGQVEKTLGPLDIFVTYLYGARCDKRVSGTRKVPNVAQASRELLKVASSGRSLQIFAPHDSEENAVPLSFSIDLANYDGIVYPDSSARRRQTWLHSSGLPELIFGKARNQETGEIIGLTKPHDPIGTRLLVADDMCDGGATFVKVAEMLPGYLLDLCVAHALFSGSSLERLTQAGYGQIFTTDSFVQHLPEQEQKVKARCQVQPIWNEYAATR